MKINFMLIKVPCCCIIRTCVCIALLLTNNFSSRAQETVINRTIAATPNVASLYKSFERPSATSTGIPEISIPLTSVEQGAFKIPITLQYNGGGIKVEEIASWVGLGWSLSAGGNVTRIVRGLPDDDVNGFYNSTILSEDGSLNTMLDISQNLKDVEPDLYYYSINGQSGQFYFNNNRQIVQDDYTGVHIQQIIISQKIAGWIITDGLGNKYYLGINSASTYDAVDLTIPDNNEPYILSGVKAGMPPYNSTWHLTEMSDINGLNKIEFKYNSAVSAISVKGEPTRNIWIFSGSPTTNLDGAALGALTQVQEKYLWKIITPNSQFVFNSSQDREDYDGRKLDNISIVNNNSLLIKKIQFNYEYRSAYPVFAGSADISKRMRLLSFSELNDLNNVENTHSFQYYDQVPLPHRFSIAVDYWGYSNGEYYNTSGLPSINYYPIEINFGPPEVKRFNYDKKESNFNYAVASSLKRVTYPTGGYREYIYEGNEVLYDAQPDVQIIQVSPDAAPQGGTVSINNSHLGPYQGHEVLYQTPFTVNSTDGQVNFHWECGRSDMSYSVALCNSSGQLIQNLTEILDNGQRILANGSYFIQVRTSIPIPDPNGFYYFDAFWEESRLDRSATNRVNRYGREYYKYNVPAGGIRIKQIKDVDPLTGAVQTTNFSYGLPASPTLSSGLLISSPMLALKFQEIDQNGLFNVEVLKLSGLSHYPLGSQAGSHVMYTDVTVSENNNGRTQMQYSFDYDEINGDLNYPLPPVTSKQAFRGNLVKKHDFNNAGHLLRESTFDYYIKPFGSINTYKLATIWRAQSYPPYIPLIGQASFYHISFYKKILLKTEDLEYDNGLPILSKKEYTYFDTYPYFNVLTEKTFLNNKTSGINYRYSFNAINDFTFGLSPSDLELKPALLSKNYLQPLETSVTVTPAGGTSMLIGGSKSSFYYFNGNQIHLGSLKEFSTLSKYRETIFSAYDTRGNLMEKYQPGGAREVYLWGYNGLYPVAKVIGSDLGTVNGLVISSILENPSSDIALQSHLNGLRSSLSGSPVQVSIYTYKPLTGMTSMTDGKGMTVYYEYDNFQRLKLIKDQEGNIIKNYQYNYKH